MKQLLLALLLVALTLISPHAIAQSRYVNGGELYWLKTPDDFALWYWALKYRLVFDASWPDGGSAKIPDYIPPSLKYTWPAKISQGFGVIDAFNGDKGPVLRPAADIAASIKNGLARADEYVWFFPNQMDYLKGASEEYVNAIEGATLKRGHKKLVLFGSFDPDGKPTNTPQYIAANMVRLRKLPFDGLTVSLRKDAENYQQALTRQLYSTTSVKTADIARALAPLNGQKRFELFLQINVGLSVAPQIDDDKGIATLLSNMARVGAVIKKQKLTGVMMDTENYEDPKTNCWLSCPNATPAQQAKAFKLGQQVAAALDCKIITTIAPIYAMTKDHPWGVGYELLGPFVAGLALN